MGRRSSNKITDAAGKLHARVLWCRQLAVGAADRRFAELLENLARRLESESIELNISSGRNH
jgi:hypothetical protein